MDKHIQSICLNCNPEHLKPGQMIRVDDEGCCTSCGKFIADIGRIYSMTEPNHWDIYFYTICNAVATKSPCLSRKIGAILVRDKSILSTGYNGPPRGIPHCGHDRFMKDRALQDAIASCSRPIDTTRFRNECPRQVLGYQSGTHMELCPAQHAEENAISNAARLGVSVIGSTLYMNCVIPCKGCFGTLINSGVIEIVVEETKVYDKYTQFLIDNSTIHIRKFEI